MRHVYDAAQEALDDMRYEQEHRELFAPIPFRIKELDKALGGMKGGAYWGVGGGPKSGKTTFEVHVADILAAANRGKVAIFGCEEIDTQLATRLLVKQTNSVDRNDIYRLEISEQGFLELESAKEILKQNEFYVEDSVFTMAEIIQICEREGIAFAFIDYLGLLRDVAGKTEQERLASISRMIMEARTKNKKTAKKKGIAPITFIMIYQLNKSGTTFGTSALYMDCDAILELTPSLDAEDEVIDGMVDINLRPSRIVKAEKAVRVHLDGAHSRIRDIVVFDFADVEVIKAKDKKNGNRKPKFQQSDFDRYQPDND